MPMTMQQIEAMPPMTLTRARAFIAKTEWHFAKTMAKNPHWYCLRRKCYEPEFVAFVKFIRAYGYDRPFYRSKYRTVDIGEYCYWTMGCPLHDSQKDGTILVNRARIIEPKPLNNYPHDDYTHPNQ